METIDDVEKELSEATQRAWTLVQSTDGRLFTVRPNASSWSAAECLSHLSISTEMFLPVLEKALSDARQRGLILKKGGLKMDVIGRVLRWFLEPPIRQRTLASITAASPKASTIGEPLSSRRIEAKRHPRAETLVTRTAVPAAVSSPKLASTVTL